MHKNTVKGGPIALTRTKISPTLKIKNQVVRHKKQCHRKVLLNRFQLVHLRIQKLEPRPSCTAHDTAAQEINTR